MIGKTLINDGMNQWAPTAVAEFGKVVWIYPFSPYAADGEILTCESGHDICKVTRPIVCGEPFDVSAFDFCFDQKTPNIGVIEAPCVKCGARWFKGMYYHFPNGWRVSK